MESPERIWQLIAKNLNNETSSPERDELFGLLQQDPSLQQQYEFLTRIWKEKEATASDEEDARQHIVRIISRAETESGERVLRVRRMERRRRLLVAASLLFIILTASWLLLPRGRSGTAATKEGKEALVVPNGSRIRSMLPDGSTVWLNAGSRLFFINDFTGATREVRLEGEAFFDIVKKPGQPFIVHTSGIDIRVLGTAFNVKDYPGDQAVETTLYRGLIQVSRPQGGTEAPIELRPNEKLVLSKDEFAIAGGKPENDKQATTIILPRFTLTQIDSAQKESERLETAWLYSRLEFRGDSFKDLARKLERWYNVRVIFTDEKAEQLSFNGSFEKETVEQAFEALKAANAFSYKIIDDEIYVGSPE